MAQMIIENGIMKLPITDGFSDTGAVSKTLKTAGKFVDKNIEIDVQVPTAVYEAAEGGETVASIDVAESRVLSTGTTKYPINITAGASVSAGTMKVKTPGWTNETINVDAGSDTETETLYIKEGKLSNAGDSKKTYAEDTETIVNIADGFLYIDEGYLPDTKISLGTLIPDIDDDAADENILQGHTAYNEDGQVITGTMGYSNVGTTSADPTITSEVNAITVGAATVAPAAGDSTKFTVTTTASVTGSASVEVTKGFVDKTSTLTGSMSKTNNVTVNINASEHSDSVTAKTSTAPQVGVTMSKACNTSGYDISGVLETAPAVGPYITVGALASQNSAGSYSVTVNCTATEGYTQGYEEIDTVSDTISVADANNASYIAVYTGEFE